MSEANYSKVGEFEFPFRLSNNETFIWQAGLKGWPLLKFKLKVWMKRRHTNANLKNAFKKKMCYYGPFKGEFGHFTAHTLPFLMYLHKHGVKIIYCGMELHKPFLVDEQGRSIIHEYVPLRDFFHESTPKSNAVTPPDDVAQVIEKFSRRAKKSGLPYWDIGDDFYYWFVHRHWVAAGHTHLYDLSKVYKTATENAVCLFPRGKGAKATHNNGEQWDYQALVKKLEPFYDKIYVVGHPSQSLSIEGGGKVALRITADNAQILEACSNSRLMITPHSGVNNLGEYVQKQVLIIYKGGSKVSDIGSMNNTLFFRQAMQEKFPLAFAFTEQEIMEYIKKHQAKWN